MPDTLKPLYDPHIPPCEKCGSVTVKPTLTTSVAQYWRCYQCGHVWATDKKTVASIHA